MPYGAKTDQSPRNLIFSIFERSEKSQFRRVRYPSEPPHYNITDSFIFPPPGSSFSTFRANNLRRFLENKGRKSTINHFSLRFLTNCLSMTRVTPHTYFTPLRARELSKILVVTGNPVKLAGCSRLNGEPEHILDDFWREFVELEHEWSVGQDLGKWTRMSDLELLERFDGGQMIVGACSTGRALGSVTRAEWAEGESKTQKNASRRESFFSDIDSSTQRR